jgi:CheY-like chemotaxis protein
LGDPGRLRQILVNLLGNAIKFTAQGSVVLTVALAQVETGQHTLTFTVADTGMGIAPDKLGTIFEAFSQADSSITRRFGGTGLGLPISAKLAHAFGGTIEVSSQLGVGSQFSVSIPFELDESNPTAPVDLSALKGLRALVVDGNSVNRAVLVALLMGAGLVVQALDSGEQALALLLETPDQAPRFDLLLVDDRAPIVSGFMLAERLHQRPALAPMRIVMMSSSGVKGDAQKAYALGFSAYVSRPCTRQQWWVILLRVMARDPSHFAELVTQHTARDSQRPPLLQAHSYSDAPD